MTGQCLSNKNKSATVSKFKNFLDLNKALGKGRVLTRNLTLSINRLVNRLCIHMLKKKSKKYLFNGLTN